MLLGAVFLGIKVYEYCRQVRRSITCPVADFHLREPVRQPRRRSSSSLYFAMTGLHALHMIIGVGVMSVISWWPASGTITRRLLHTGRDAGLYWHFVDIVWIFLFPLLYLIGAA